MTEVPFVSAGISERTWLAGMAMHTILQWSGQWGIDIKSKRMNDCEAKVLISACQDLADRMLLRLRETQDQTQKSEDE